MITAVAVIDILDHLLAPLVLEIDVDVGRLAAIFRDEAREQEPALVRIDRGDPQAIADRTVRRRAAALAEDVLAAGIGDDVVDGQEITRIVELGDDRELLVEPADDISRNPFRIEVPGITPFRALP